MQQKGAVIFALQQQETSVARFEKYLGSVLKQLFKMSVFFFKSILVSQLESLTINWSICMNLPLPLFFLSFYFANCFQSRRHKRKQARDLPSLQSQSGFC